MGIPFFILPLDLGVRTLKKAPIKALPLDFYVVFVLYWRALLRFCTFIDSASADRLPLLPLDLGCGLPRINKIRVESNGSGPE